MRTWRPLGGGILEQRPEEGGGVECVRKSQEPGGGEEGRRGRAVGNDGRKLGRAPSL